MKSKYKAKRYLLCMCILLVRVYSKEFELTKMLKKAGKSTGEALNVIGDTGTETLSNILYKAANLANIIDSKEPNSNISSLSSDKNKAAEICDELFSDPNHRKNGPGSIPNHSGPFGQIPFPWGFQNGNNFPGSAPTNMRLDNPNNIYNPYPGFYPDNFPQNSPNNTPNAFPGPVPSNYGGNNPSNVFNGFPSMIPSLPPNYNPGNFVPIYPNGQNIGFQTPNPQGNNFNGSQQPNSTPNSDPAKSNSPTNSSNNDGNGISDKKDRSNQSNDTSQNDSNKKPKNDTDKNGGSGSNDNCPPQTAVLTPELMNLLNPTNPTSIFNTKSPFYMPGLAQSINDSLSNTKKDDKSDKNDKNGDSGDKKDMVKVGVPQTVNINKDDLMQAVCAVMNPYNPKSPFYKGNKTFSSDMCHRDNFFPPFFGKIPANNFCFLSPNEVAYKMNMLDPSSNVGSANMINNSSFDGGMFRNGHPLTIPSNINNTYQPNLSNMSNLLNLSNMQNLPNSFENSNFGGSKNILNNNSINAQNSNKICENLISKTVTSIVSNVLKDMENANFNNDIIENNGNRHDFSEDNSRFPNRSTNGYNCNIRSNFNEIRNTNNNYNKSNPEKSSPNNNDSNHMNCNSLNDNQISPGYVNNNRNNNNNNSGNINNNDYCGNNTQNNSNNENNNQKRQIKTPENKKNEEKERNESEGNEYVCSTIDLNNLNSKNKDNTDEVKDKKNKKNYMKM
ncbi:hypothetical protein EDEG_02167 [Edhazardia aedis USNM 41457]|uniref:Uncharacterized protein n=1 Tax=Edhazardia aedis (strain USNM 41457) TaxID=1003232 RepID=J8ZUY7_EDHAE|nr:hypothetical protein EDEG_02167 [Edhazardia aedis USNM 41457]|eukprot:EJW03493.1 hypothetical protein EDEG_02167 [Edhazardia aedis USNM 41457]